MSTPAPVKNERLAVLKAAASKINKELGNVPVVQSADEIMKNSGAVPRWTTGIFGLDYGLGGGIPAGQISMFWGERSTGKTTTAMRVVGTVQKSCAACFQLLTVCKCQKKVPGTVVWIDTEGTWDRHLINWAKTLGVNLSELIVARPSTGEQTVDILKEYLKDGQEADFIVLDSIAQMTPSKEIEVSAEENQQGLMARITNKGFRIWTSLQNSLMAKYGRSPTILAVNQIRFKMTAYGDPRTPPGGHGQEFAISTWTEMYRRGGKEAAELFDKATGKPFAGMFGYKVIKNRTSVAGREGDYMLIFTDTQRRKKGDIVEETEVIGLAKAVGMIEGVRKLTMDGKEYESAAELEDFWIANPAKYAEFKRKLMEKLLSAEE